MTYFGLPCHDKVVYNRGSVVLRLGCECNEHCHGGEEHSRKACGAIIGKTSVVTIVTLSESELTRTTERKIEKDSSNFVRRQPRHGKSRQKYSKQGCRAPTPRPEHETFVIVNGMCTGSLPKNTTSASHVYMSTCSNSRC